MEGRYSVVREWFFVHRRMILVSPRDDAQRDEGQPLSEPERLALLDKALQVAAELKGINPLRLYRHARTTDALFCRLQAGTSKLQAPLFHTRSRDLKTVEDSFLTSLADILDSGPPSTAREDNLSRSVFDLIHHFRDLQVTPQNEAFLMNGLLDALVECAECAVCFDGESDCVFQCGHSVCKSCSKKLDLCPFCRQEIRQRFKNDLAQDQQQAATTTTTSSTTTTTTTTTNATTSSTIPPPAVKKMHQHVDKSLLYKLVPDIRSFIENRFKGLVTKTGAIDDVTKSEIEIFSQDPQASLLMLPILLDPATTFKSEEALSYSLGKMFLHNVLNFNPKLSSKISAIQIEDQKLRAKEQGKGAVRGGGGGGGGSAGGGKWSIEQIAFADSIKLLVKSPSFLIRILSTISGELPTPDSKPNIKPTRPFARWIVECFNNMSTKIAQVQLQQRRGVYLWLFKKIHIGTYNATQYKHAHALAGMLRGGARAPNDRPVGVNQVGKVELGRGGEGRRGRAPTSRAVIIRRTTPRSPKPDPKYFFYKSPMSSFNTYYNAANLEGIITLFKEAPGLLFRYARCTLARLQSHGSVAIEEFSNILPPLFHLLKSNQIVELLHIMKHATQLHQYEVVYRVKNSSFYYPEVKKDQQIECAKKKNKNISTTIATSTTAPVIAAPASATAKVPSAELCNNVCSLLSKELDTRRHTPTMKTVLWIQDDVPWSTMHISKGRDKGVPAWVSSTCATGDVVKVDDDARVILFMHWMQSIDQTIDLDLSCVFYNEKGYTIGSCSFTQPSAFNGSCKHSGDLTSAPGPKGSSEFVTFKVSDLAHHRVSKVAICIYSYSGQSFDLMPRAFVGIGVIPDSGGDNTVAGDGPNGCHVIAASNLSGKSMWNLSGAFDIPTSTFCFINTNINERGNMVEKSDTWKNLMRFYDWSKSRMPPSWAHILNCAKHCFDTIKYTILNSSDSSSCVTRDVLTFARRENESVTQFIKRVESKTDFDDKFSLDQQDNGEDKEEKMDDKTTPQPDPCLAVYWGTNPPSQLLVKGSIIISKKDPKLDREDVSWTTDPFASF